MTDEIQLRTREERAFTEAQIRSLYSHSSSSLDLSEERLSAAIDGSDIVLSAWCGNDLVGIARILTDGASVALIPELIVRHEYDKLTVANALLKQCSARLPHLPIHVLRAP